MHLRCCLDHSSERLVPYFHEHPWPWLIISGVAKLTHATDPRQSLRFVGYDRLDWGFKNNWGGGGGGLYNDFGGDVLQSVEDEKRVSLGLFVDFGHLREDWE